MIDQEQLSRVREKVRRKREAQRAKLVLCANSIVRMRDDEDVNSDCRDEDEERDSGLRFRRHSGNVRE